MAAALGLCQAAKADNVVRATVGTSADNDAADEADKQEETRINPGLDYDNVPPAAPADYSKYPFINLAANHIDLNGADWTRLQDLLADVDNQVVSIVHIGDSHLQAEGATTRTRSLLQHFYGSSGRGLITPFKLAGTNQPDDYTIETGAPMTTASLMRKPWKSDMGFTGVSLTPGTDKYSFEIGVKEVDGDNQNFDVIKIFCRGPVPKPVSATTKRGNVDFETSVRGDTVTIWLKEPVTKVKLDLNGKGRCNIFGFKLENSMVGVEYHVIGNNGAQYATYNSLGGVGKDIQALSPSLVILSMGTNEAFGDLSDDAFRRHVDKLVNDILQHNLDAAILITTPAECQWKPNGTYTINKNVKRMRDVLVQYGRDNNIPVYDWYEVAGGDGSSTKWIEKDLFARDRIHNSWPGYHLQGNLFYDALIKAFTPALN